MKFDYKRKIGIKELGLATGKPYLSLIGNVIDGNDIDVGRHIKKSFFRFIINGDKDCSFLGTRNGKCVNQIATDFIAALSLQKNDIIRIYFDTDYKKSPFLINIEVPEERFNERDKNLSDLF